MNTTFERYKEKLFEPESTKTRCVTVQSWSYLIDFDELN